MTYDTINDAVTRAGGAGTLLAGRYRIVRQLGQGGMGSVWLAEDTQLDNKPFAIKMLPSILVSNKRAYRQLKDEALVAMQLVHPNIVQIRAFEENDGNPFLVMDYVDGQTLDDCLAEKGRLPEAEVVRLLKPIAAALDYAHAKGVVHRDVKPGNVMIAKDGTPYILDFGIAREIQETMTRVTGKLSSGTLLYMSPEQLMGESPNPAQDVYSFAAMAYECLKGEPPFSHGQIEFQIMNKQPEPLRSDGALAVGIMAGLAKKPEDRPATCAAVLRGSGTLAASVGTVNGSGKSAASPNQQQSGGPRSVAALKGLIAAALLAIVGGVWLVLSRTDRSPVREVSAPRETVDSSVDEASATGSKNFGLVSREAESRISSSIRISVLNQAPDGRIFVGFTDLSVQPSQNYYLAVGEKRGEWQVIEADPDNRLVTLSKYGTRVTVKLGGEDGASADKRKKNQERTVAEERKAAVVAETERRATHLLPLTPVWAKPAPQVYAHVHDKVQLWEGGPYWATTNIGAEKPEDSGYYFWWGDTVGYKREGGAWVASDGYQSRFPFSKGIALTCWAIKDVLKSTGWITADGVLAPEHDAAHMQWGGGWRMPTRQELHDLSSKCDWMWTTRNGVQGYEVRGKGAYASARIFLPCAGYGYGTSLLLAGSYGYYWSSVPSSDYNDYSWYLDFGSGYHSTGNYGRYYGRSVRPVQGFTK